MDLDIEKMIKDNNIEIEFDDGDLTEYTYALLRGAVAETIIKYRKKMGYTQSDLAKILNVSQARVARVEDGINITLKTLCDINSAIETKDYSFILDVLENMKTTIKDMRKLNYSYNFETTIVYDFHLYNTEINYIYEKENDVEYEHKWEKVS